MSFSRKSMDCVLGEQHFDYHAWRRGVQLLGFHRVAQNLDVGVIDGSIANPQTHVAAIGSARSVTRGVPQLGEDVPGDPVMPRSGSRDRVDLARHILVLGRAGLFHLEEFFDRRRRDAPWRLGSHADNLYQG
jgi:hypothetical protein